jgi:glucose/arabinose dehydrogenase
MSAHSLRWTTGMSLLAACAAAPACTRAQPATAAGTPASEAPVSVRAGCEAGNGGLTLPPGFCASVFAEGLGHTRHLAAGPGGVLYANSWSSKYTQMKNVPGGYVVALRDGDGDGRAEQVERFGSVHRDGKAGGGTGIAVHGDALYVEVDDRIVRYRLGSGLRPAGAPETVLGGLPMDGDHPMHPFAIAPDGSLFVNSGSASNACQVKNRAPFSPGRKPCGELATRAGLWQYDAAGTGQRFSAAARYATGLRNTVAPAVNPADGALYAAVHGRDQLSGNWPKLYTEEQNNELPAEVFARVEKGDDFGWPYCYYDATQGKNVLAPEYGGDGGRAEGGCAGKKRPDVAFPAHWAPEATVFYSASTFPAKYQGGAFVSFHGSWNRAPAQAGFLVAYVPFEAGRPTGRYEEFATGFAGKAPPADPKQAAHRPMGLAVGQDGALYVSDDAKGRVWRIVYAAGS